MRYTTAAKRTKKPHKRKVERKPIKIEFSENIENVLMFVGATVFLYGMIGLFYLGRFIGIIG